MNNGNKIKIFSWMIILFLLQVVLYVVFTKDTFSSIKTMFFSGSNYWTVPKVEVLSSALSINNDHNLKEFKILFWTHSFYQFGKKWFGSGKEPFMNCLYKNCVAADDRRDYNISDVVLFNMWFISRHRDDLPNYKFTHQKWIFHIMEAPANEEEYSKYNGLFNATWTYSKNSDIYTPYSYPDTASYSIVKINFPRKKLKTKNYAAKKTKLIAWFVGNCGTVQSSRWQYVSNLNYHIPVHIYGSCGNYKCERKKDSECNKMLKRDYKFYLSFENSLCDDYVTEKLWRAVHIDIIPIVIGAANYSSFMPPKSYIDVKDFRSSKQLAEYLTLLSNNDALYNSYFTWKGIYKFQQNVPDQCKLCEYLNKSANQTKVYDNMEVSWSTTSVCHSPEDYYQTVDKTAWLWNPLQKHKMFIV